jgi:hypothetical protein
MRLLAEDQTECSDKLFSITLNNVEHHRSTFNLTAELSRMAIRNFVLAHRSTVLSDMCAAQVETTLAVRNNFLVNSPVPAIVLDLPALSSNLKPDVFPTPQTSLRALHFAIRLACLTVNVPLLMRAVLCEKTYHKSKGKNNDIDFSGLAQHDLARIFFPT